MFWRLVAYTISFRTPDESNYTYLSNLPMYAGASRGWKTGKVNDEIPYLTEEIILVGVPVHFKSTSERRNFNSQDILPPPSAYGSESMTAIPAKFGAAFKVGSVIASPMNCV